MKENTIEYDFIIRLRLDDCFFSEFILTTLEEHEILVNSIMSYNNSIKLQDHFFMCKPNTFFNIASLYDNIPTVIETINNNNCWLPLFGYQETILLIQTIMNQVQIKKAGFSCSKLV